MSTSYRSNLSDAEWECLQRHPPPLPKRGRQPMHSLRTIFDAIFYVLHTGCPWRYLPQAFHRGRQSSPISGVCVSKGHGRSSCERCIGLNANDKEGILTQVQPAWMRHPLENGRGVVWDLWLRCPQAHQRAETASSCGYAGNPHFHLRDPCRHARYPRGLVVCSQGSRSSCHV
jgi:hypothetical protein